MPHYHPLRAKASDLQLGVGMGDVLASLEPTKIGQLTSGDNPYQSLSQDGMALANRAEAYAVQPSVSPPSPSGNPRLNPCKPGGFSETAYKSAAIPPHPEGLGLPCDWGCELSKYAVCRPGNGFSSLVNNPC